MGACDLNRRRRPRLAAARNPGVQRVRPDGYCAPAQYAQTLSLTRTPRSGENRSMSMVPSTPDRADPGDETFRRFRYQATYAATLAVGLLEEESDVLEIYCEHYEDILLRMESGRCRGVQVKTKGDEAERLKATDQPILDSLVRFVELDVAFPGVFEGFTLATNGAFDRRGKGHGNLLVVTAEAQQYAADPTQPCAKARKLCRTVARTLKKKAAALAKKPKALKKKSGKKKDAAGSTNPGGDKEAPAQPLVKPKPSAPTEEQILQVLAKLDVQDDLPKLPDIRSRMGDRLAQLSPTVASSTLPALRRLTQSLEYLAYIAASRGDEDRLGSHWFVADPARRKQLRASEEIAAKCLSRQHVEAEIARYCTGALLVAAEPVSPDSIPADLSLLDRKLVAGGLSVATVSMAHDAVASVEEHGAALLYIHDVPEGRRRHNHARAVAKKEAALAYESQVAAGKVSGPAMLTEIERRLKKRRAEDDTGVLTACAEEHLLGHVFSLTKECVVWWSESRVLGAVASSVDDDSNE